MYQTFEEAGIIIPKGAKNQIKVLCPRCSNGRVKSLEECLSVSIEQGVWNCFHCHWASGLFNQHRMVEESYAKRDYTLPNYDESNWELLPEAIEWFKNRGISEDTLKANHVGSAMGHMTGREKDQPPYLILSFPYFKKDKIVNIKYRRADEKTMRFCSGAEVCFYNMQNCFEEGYLATNKIHIVEGELDALAMYEAGFRYTLSVPNGSPFGNSNSKASLGYLDDPDFINIWKNVNEIVLCGDNDEAGKGLIEELANRLGVEKCFSVEYPEGKKDANEVLVDLGADALAESILDYRPMLQGLVTVSSMADRLLTYYNDGDEGGMTCGLNSLDEIFTTQHSQLIVVTGSPECKKSICMDNITLGLASGYGIHSCLYSPESRPMEMHISRLASIHNGYRLGTPADEDRMPYMEYKASCEWVGKHYSFIQPPNNTLAEILQLWKISLVQHNSRIFVLDPYSKVNWDGENEHQFIRRMLNELGEFAYINRVTVFVIAHPKKVELQYAKKGEPQDYKIVQPYDISGSANWYNSADIILSLWTSRYGDNPPLHVYVQKSKLHHIAKSGKHCVLDYNFDNWRLGESLYEDVQIQQDFA